MVCNDYGQNFRNHNEKVNRFQLLKLLSNALLNLWTDPIIWNKWWITREKKKNKLIEFFVLLCIALANDWLSWIPSRGLIFIWYLLRIIKIHFSGVLKLLTRLTLKAIYVVISIISISLSIKLKITICLDRL